MHLRICQSDGSKPAGPQQARNLGNILEVCKDRRETESVRGVELHRDGCQCSVLVNSGIGRFIDDIRSPFITGNIYF